MDQEPIAKWAYPCEHEGWCSWSYVAPGTGISEGAKRTYEAIADFAIASVTGHGVVLPDGWASPLPALHDLVFEVAERQSFTASCFIRRSFNSMRKLATRPVTAALPAAMV